VTEAVGRKPIRSHWPSEREVALEVPIEATPSEARRLLESVPLWFHTFALNREQEIYTPGKARDHGYRLASLPDSFAGLSVLDVGAFDGFYSFLAEARGARRVLAIDNEQYLAWVRERWGVTLTGGEGFRAIHRLRNSRVEYRRLDAFALERIEERFDFIFCFGLLHRVENPLGLLRVLTSRLAEGGRMLIETYGTGPERDGSANGALHVPKPGEIYAHDRFVYWQFTPGSLANLLSFTGHPTFELHAAPVVDGHPRLIAEVR
jgi:tRNA (mo5U34)-methyltransferase